MAFAPEMWQAHDCNWDYGFDRMGGEYFFAVQAVIEDYRFYRIAYLPAYYWDCGPVRDGKCALFDFLASLVGKEVCNPHSGDTEFIIVDVRYNPGSNHWETQKVFLSAHCPWGVGNLEGCLWWPPDFFTFVDGKRYGAPVVYVSQGKHANPNALFRCNRGGAYGTDSCEFSTTPTRFPVIYTQQNIGSRAVPLRDCGSAFWGSSITNPLAAECMWTTNRHYTRFDGWLGFSYGEPTPPYGSHLLTYAGF